MKIRWSKAKILAALGGAVLLAGGGLAAYAAQSAAARERSERAVMLTGGAPERAHEHIRNYGCAGCHDIPGIDGPEGLVGPPLGTIGKRVYIAGVMTNTPGNLVDWIVNPPSIDPMTAMPVTGISEAEARDVAAYLYSLP